MSLEQQLNDILKQAMKDKAQATADTVRMIKTKLMERRTARGFTGTIDDPIVLEVIAAYKKQLEKSLEEYQKAGAAGISHADGLVAEIAFCERFLPKMLDEAAVRALVHERRVALAVNDPKQAGRLMGDIMKSHKGQVDSALVKRLVDEELGKAG